MEVNSLEDVVKLIQRLYSPGSSNEVNQIETALQKFQRSQEGWQLANALLQHQDRNVRFFGALTFTIKINQDWQVPPLTGGAEAYCSLRSSLSESDATLLLHELVGWLVRLTNGDETSIVVRKLCSALIAYYLKPSEPWKKCLRHLIVSIKEGNAVTVDIISSTTSQALSVHTPSIRQIKAVLWFAGGLVEEVNKADAKSIQTNKYFERVSSNIDDIVEVLHYSLTADRDVELGIEAIKCFQSWVMYAQRGWFDKGPELESLRRLTPLAIDALRYEDMEYVVLQLFTEILLHFSFFLTPDDLRTLSIFLTSEKTRNVLSRLKDGDYGEDTTAYAGLMLAFGDAKVEDLIRNFDDPQSIQIAAQLLELLRCDGYCGIDEDISPQALEFWQTYAETVNDYRFDSEGGQMPWIDASQQRLMTVIEACWTKIRMPPPEVTATWSSDSDAKLVFSSFRQDVYSILEGSYPLLGVDLFEKLASLALQSINARDWIPLEATLFCINALSDSVAHEDLAHEILSRLFGSEMFAFMTNAEEPIPDITQQTTVNMISRYTGFFKKHAEYLPVVLNFLFESLKSPALGNVVAKAIFLICSNCRETLTSELNAFMLQYDMVSAQNNVEAVTKEKLIGAIAAIVESLPTDEEKLASLTRLTQFVQRDAANCIQAMESSQAEEFQEKGLGALRCLVGMGKALQAPDHVVIDLEVDRQQSGFWVEGQGAPLQAGVIEILKTITALMQWNSDITETGCQVLRTGYKENTPGLFVFPPQVTIDFVLACGLDTARVDYVLETAGMLLNKSCDHMEVLNGAASSFLGHLIVLVSAMAYDPSTDPEVSTAVIQLMYTMLPRYISRMVDLPGVEVLFDFALKALTVPDTMPKRSAAQFWAKFADKQDLPESILNFVQAALARYGPLVSRILVWKIAGQGTRGELEELAEPLKKLVFAQPSARTWLLDALIREDFPSQKVSVSDRRVWLKKIMGLRGAKGTNQVVKDFWIQCRGPEFAYTS